MRRKPFYQGNIPVSTRCHHRRFIFVSLFHPIFKTTGSCLAATLLRLWEILRASLNYLMGSFAIAGSCKVLILMKVINILKMSAHSNHLLLDSLETLKIISWPLQFLPLFCRIPCFRETKETALVLCILRPVSLTIQKPVIFEELNLLLHRRILSVLFSKNVL